MARARTPARPQQIDLRAVLPTLRGLLERDRVLNAAALARAGVPRPQHAEAVALLEAEGFERAKAAVRVPVRNQILAVVHERQSARLQELARLVRGASLKEVKSVVDLLVRDGSVKLVFRGKIDVVSAPSISSLTREELAALSRACRTLSSLSARALKKSTATILREDLREQLLDLMAPRQPDPPATEVAPPTLTDLVVAELGRQLRPIGLCFVPDAVRALESHGLATTQAALLDAARGGRIELQPDSGLNRLSTQELDLCPPGPQGTRLSWARILPSAP